jgi:hypothetical protein
MRRYWSHVVAGLLLVTVVVGSVAGVSAAGVGAARSGHLANPTLKTVLSSGSIAAGGSATDTATLTGNKKSGSPTGTVTFFVCGPTTSPTACGSPNISAGTVGLSAETKHRSTAGVTISPGTPGWYCFLDEYQGDAHYKPVSDDATASECLDVTGSTTGPTTPTLTSALSPSSIAPGSSATDFATVTGGAAHGAPTGTVTFSICGATASPTPCTSPNNGPFTVGLSQEPNTDSSTAALTVIPGTVGWYCFLDQYSGDTNYTSVSDNDTATECLDVTSSTTGPITPTLTTVLSSSSIPFGATATDTATVTGTTAGGSPTGTLTFSVCGPTAQAMPCTSPNVGSATAELSSESNNRSVASGTLDPGTPGWYCFLDQYNGDAHYTSVSDNDTATECLDVTSSTTGPITPTLTTVLSSPSIPFGATATDTATVTGTTAGGSPTGTLTFSVCGPTAQAMPCTSPNVGPATAELSPESNNRAVASGTLDPGAPGWYCFLDQYNGDAHYTAVTDNNTASECLDVTGSSTAGARGATTLEG